MIWIFVSLFDGLLCLLVLRSYVFECFSELIVCVYLVGYVLCLGLICWLFYFVACFDLIVVILFASLAILLIVFGISVCDWLLLFV